MGMTIMRRELEETAQGERPTLMRGVRLPLWRESLFGLEWLALRCSPVYSGHGIPHGDNSPVVVVPGLFATDVSLAALHSWLSRIGYRPYFSGIGLNARCPDILIDRLVETVDKAFAETGQKVTLIGHSLGGLLARGAAIRRPTRVAQVITLGSPLQGVAAHPTVIAAAELISGPCSGDCLAALQEPLPSSIAEASIYTKDDGVVDWRTCIQNHGATNIEVRGTHIGLICNPQVYRLLAELLVARSAARSGDGTEPYGSWADPSTTATLWERDRDCSGATIGVPLRSSSRGNGMRVQTEAA